MSFDLLDVDVELVPIGFVILTVLTFVFRIWARDRWVRLTLGGALLLLSYLALQFSWDILHVNMRGYVGSAPGPGVLAFLFGPAGLVLGIIALALLATSWRAVLWRFVALAAVPCLVVMAYHAQEGIKIAKLQQQRENEWLRERHALERHIRGNSWARLNHVTDLEACSENPSGYPQFERSQEFQAGCLQGAQDTRDMEGLAWVGRRHPAADDDCEPTASDPATPEGIEACKQATRQARNQLGADWAGKNAVFATADCERGISEMPNRADYVAGCRRFVEDAGRRKP